MKQLWAIWSQAYIVILWVQCPSVGWIVGMHLRWAVRCRERGESSVSYYSPLQPVPSKSSDRPGNSHPSDLASIFMCFWCYYLWLANSVFVIWLSVVWSGVGHHVMRVTYVLSDRLDAADTRGYITVPLVGPSCLYKQYFILISAWACYNLHMWVLVKISTCCNLF